MKRLFPLLIAVLLLSSCRTQRVAVDSRMRAIVHAAVKLGFDIEEHDDHQLMIASAEWLGTPYAAGGTTKRGVDCSGLTCAIYKDVYNVQLSRRSADQLKKDCYRIRRSKLQEGDLVLVRDSEGREMGIGHYQIGSIAVRMLTFGEGTAVDDAFWHARLSEAYRLREALHLSGRADNNIYRLVHGEGDRLPGLVVDVYGRTAVMQAHSVGMHCQRNDIARALVAASQGQVDSVYYKSETTLPFKAQLQQENGFLIGQHNDVPNPILLLLSELGYYPRLIYFASHFYVADFL